MAFAGIVLAAGEGKRLRPVTDTVPKTLAFLPGGALLAHHLALLKEAGARRVVVVVKHLASRVAEFLEARGGSGTTGLVHQIGPEGLLFALRDALPSARPPVLVVHGDSFLGGSLAAFRGALTLGEAAIAVKPETRPERPPGKDVVSVDEGGQVRAFGERLPGLRHLESFGAYAVGPSAVPVVQEIAARRERDCDMIPVFRELLARGEKIRAVPWSGPHWNLNTAEEFLAASRELLAHWMRLHYQRPDEGIYLAEGDTRRIGNSRVTGPAWIGREVALHQAELGPWVTVGAGARLERATLSEAIVYPGARVSDQEISGRLVL